MLDRRSFLGFRKTGPAAPGPVSLANTQDALAPYVPSSAAPWTPARARHLLRRTGFGARPVDVDELLTMTPEAAVNRIVRTAANRPLLPEPSWIDERKPRATAPQQERSKWIEKNDHWTGELYRGTYNRMLGDGTHGRFRRLGEAFRERMTVFWSNHYVAALKPHGIAVWQFEYLQTLRRHALGNIREAVHDAGLTASMLDYLDGNRNRAGAPNENYARELLELFTMGPTGPDGTPNYTQADIVELARVLTGWRTSKHRPDAVYFEPDWFDDGSKTIFGQTGAFGYDDVVPLLFQERPWPIAHFVAGKLCREFVRDEPDPAFVAAVAQRLLDEDFELKLVLIEILQSAHFFDEAHFGALIRSPVEFMVGSQFQFGRDAYEDVLPIRHKTRKLGQDIFVHPDVRGWENGRAWINTGTITERVRYAREQVHHAPETFLPDTLARPVAADPRALTAALCQEHLAWDLSADEIDDLTNDHLRNGVSDYYWDPTTDDAARRLRDLMNHLVSLPAYQLR